jgi:tetraacyldisaccharide 4'-kinase
VLFSADRLAAGGVAETSLGATVLVLDDGFQHRGLERAVDLLIAGAHDRSDRVLPAGRLREPLTAAASADALLVDGSDLAGDDRFKDLLGVGTVFHIQRTIGRPRALASDEPVEVGPDDVILALAGIARPDRFFADLETSGLPPRAQLVFREHPQPSDAELASIARAARDAGATLILTTEKDAVRLAARSLGGLRIAAVPLTASIAAPSFADWLLSRISRRPAPRTPHPASATQHPAPGTRLP